MCAARTSALRAEETLQSEWLACQWHGPACSSRGGRTRARGQGRSGRAGRRRGVAERGLQVQRSGWGASVPCVPRVLRAFEPILGRGFESHHAKAQACSAGNTWWRLEEVAPGNGCRGTWVTLGLLAGGRHSRKRQSCFLFGY